MYNVMVLGAGKIGSLAAYMLTQTKQLQIYLVDLQFDSQDSKRILQVESNLKSIKLDVSNSSELTKAIKDKKITALVSTLPFFLNKEIAKIAHKTSCHYFDLTEDVAVSKYITAIAKQSNCAFVSQCGLAPGFVNIATNSLVNQFKHVHSAKIRVGALPMHSNNGLRYALNWSTDGLINEYGNFCYGIENKEPIKLLPLEGLETVILDGTVYEAFNTSGGSGTLVNSLQHKVDNLNYKTLRYPGHCEKMRFLMKDLQLNKNRETLKKILEAAIPTIREDVVLIYISVEGWIEDVLREKVFVRTLMSQTIADLKWSAIQISTAASLTAIVEEVLLNNTKMKYQGAVLQEQFELNTVLKHKFGRYYDEEII